MNLNTRRKHFHSHIERKRHTLAAIEGWQTMARRTSAQVIESLTLRGRHPYCEAERLFTAGRIPVAQAVGMILSDREYIAECELAGRDKRVYAECIVRDQWARRMLEVSPAPDPLDDFNYVGSRHHY